MAALDGTITMTSSEYRPCYVDGKKALFHKWEDKETPILHIDARLTPKAIRRIADKAEIGILPPEGNITIQKQTVAIVEYESGKIEEVEPTRIKFADGKIREYAFIEK